MANAYVVSALFNPVSEERKCMERRQPEAVCGQKLVDGGIGASLCARPQRQEGNVRSIPFRGLRADG